MDRRTFLARAGLVATWAGVAIQISACSEDDAATAPEGGGNDAVGTVSGGDHDHAGAVVTGAQLGAGDAVLLTLTGSGHAHSVSLSAEQVGLIAMGQRVTVTSSTNNAHRHTVVFG